MRYWGDLYTRPPIAWDALLFIVALSLHAPLLTLHMTAPRKDKRTKLNRLVNIDYIEQQIKKRKEKPIVLPPKMPEAPKKLQEMLKKAEAMKQQVFKRSLPAPLPAPPPKLAQNLATGPQAAKLAEKLRDSLDQNKKILQGKGSFQDKQLATGPASRELKINAGGAAIAAAGSRLGGIGAPVGGTLKGKGSFQMSENAMPASIGGDDNGGLKMGGPSNIVVVPVGARAKADASILSQVAKKDRGPLTASGPVLAAGPALSAAGPSLAGAGAAAPIAIGGASRRGAAPAAALPKMEGKKLEDKGMPNPLAEAAKASSAPTSFSVLPRRAAPKAQKPLFLITGPLENRAVLSREVPAYPDWARAKGIEANVVLQFTVTPEGTVKDNVFVVRTTGYPDLDDLAVNALKKWLFKPLSEGELRDEVGAITFNYSVR